jgi:sarcosine oxidase subunit gamma
MPDPVSIVPAGSRCALAVTAFRDPAPVCSALAAVLRMPAPDGPQFTREGDVFLFRLSPARFFVMAPESSSVVEQLFPALAGLASVTDQSDAWAIFTVSGEVAHEVLARVVPVDLNPRRFVQGCVASTRAGSMDVRLWKLNDEVFEIAAGRSLHADLEHALRTAARSSANQPQVAKAAKT